MQTIYFHSETRFLPVRKLKHCSTHSQALIPKTILTEFKNAFDKLFGDILLYKIIGLLCAMKNVMYVQCKRLATETAIFPFNYTTRYAVQR